MVIVFDSIAALKAHIMEELRDVVHNEIPTMVDDIIKEHINSDVYSYSPEWYTRRGMMQSGANLKHYEEDLSLLVTDETPGNTPVFPGYQPSGTDLSFIINTGAQGNKNGMWKKAFARPYIDNAQKDVDKKVIDVLRSKFG
jgi:hypothetical protein